MQEYESNLSDFYKKVVQNGICIVEETEGSNWDLFLYEKTVYSIPKKGSGADASVWCSLAHLKRHLHHVQHVCNAPAIIPSYWNILRPDVFKQLGITIS